MLQTDTETKWTSSLPSKLTKVIKQFIVPLAANIASLPSHTSFYFTRQDVLGNVMKDFLRENPEIFDEKATFIHEMQLAYDRHTLKNHT